MTTTTTDAVDVLEYAMLEATGGYTKGAAKAVVDFLELEGFTITRAEAEGIRHSAVADYLKDDKGLRPAMSEAELEATAKTIATMAFSVSNVRLIDVIAIDIAELAKKYRG